MWVVKLYQTDDMEASLQQLVDTNRNVLIYMRHKCVRPIRLRLNKLPDMHVELCKVWKPFAQATIDRWQANGGAMVYRPHPNTQKDSIPACDAMLIIESPFLITDFERITRNVRQEVVVYRPPTWELHNESMESIYPRADTYITMDTIFRSLVGRELTQEMQAALDATKFPVATTAVFTADDITALTGWSERFLKQALRYRYRFMSMRWHVYYVRMKPHHDEAMRWAYEILAKQVEVAPRQYALRANRPSGPYIHGFKTQMKRMVRENYLSIEDNIYVINTGGPPMQIDKLDAINNMYRGRWFKLKTLVDEAPAHLL